MLKARPQETMSCVLSDQLLLVKQDHETRYRL
jgi:hypothetical protein